MSLSKQVAIEMSCDFCEYDVSVTWYCRDCVNNMCEQCKRTHTRIPSCKNHVIFPIKEKRTATIKRTTVLYDCLEHAQSCQFQCRTCNKQICVLCLTTSHKSHDFLALDQYAKTIRENLYLILNSKSKEVHGITETLQTLSTHKQTYDDWMSRKFSEVNHVFDHLTDELLRLRTEIHDKIDQKRNNDIITMDLQHKRAYDFRERLQYQVKVLSSELDRCNDHDLANLKLKIETECSRLQENLSLDLPKFPCLRLIHKEEEHMDILIKVLTKIMKTDLFTLKTTNSFDVDSETPAFLDDLHLDLSVKLPGCKYIWALAGCDDGKMWVGTEDKKLRLVDNFGNVVKCIQLSQSAAHLAVLTSGDLLCSNGYGIDRTSTIQKVSVNFDISTFTRLSQAVEVGPLASTKQGNVLVAIRNSIGRGEVLYLSHSGKTISKVAQVTKEIEKVNINEEEQVLVKDSSCIWIMSLKGEFLNQIELKNELKGIRGFVCDRFSNLVCFRSGDVSSIRVLSSRGAPLKHFRLNLKCENERELDLGAIDANDFIWMKEEETIYILKYLV